MLRRGALVLLDTAPIIYVLEGHQTLARRFQGLFDRHAQGDITFAVTTITVAEVTSGPARLRAGSKLKLPDAVQAASAIAVDCDALVTHDRDFSSLRSLNVLR